VFRKAIHRAAGKLNHSQRGAENHAALDSPTRPRGFRHADAETAGFSRRGVLTATVAGTLLYSASLPVMPRRAAAATVQGLRSAPSCSSARTESVTVQLGTSEMGQGVCSGLAQVLAEETDGRFGPKWSVIAPPPARPMAPAVRRLSGHVRQLLHAGILPADAGRRARPSARC